MRGRALGVLMVIGRAAVAAAAAIAPATVSIEPPPGWADVTGKTKVRGVILALKGPESSSFIVAKMPPTAVENSAATRAYLNRALEEMKAGARMDFRTNGRVESKTMRSGLTLRFLRAELDGAPRLIVAAVEGGGEPVLATLSSAAPDAMMTPLFGALKVGAAAGVVRDSGFATSLDGQLQVALGGGLRSRDLTPVEKRQSVVLSIDGAGSEILFLKVEDEDASPKDQAAIVRATAADAVKAPVDSVSPALRQDTPAGPTAVYAWVKQPGSPDMLFAAGFLPWAYWGYSILGRGPQADELLVGALATLKAGPSGVPKLISATPKVEIPADPRRKRKIMLAMIAAICGFGAVALIVWSGGRKNANLPQ